MNKETLDNAFLEKRPNMSASSRRTYTSLVLSMSKRLSLTSIGDLQDEKEKIMTHVRGLDKEQTRKTLLSALFVLTEDQEYRAEMLSSVGRVNAQYKERKVSESRQGLNLSFDHVRSVTAKAMSEHNKDKSSFDKLQDALICALVSGVYMPPRRLMDWAYMRLKEGGDDEHYNFIRGNLKTFVFRKYKTVRLYGEQTLPVPKEIGTLIRKVKKMKPDAEWLLHNADGGQLSVTSLNRRITKLFGYSVDVLRSVYINSQVLTPEVEKAMDRADELAKQMGHSTNAARAFYAKDDI